MDLHVRKLRLRFAAVAIVAVSSAASATAESRAGDSPKLILQITVDQLRGDLPFLHRDQFGEGGFRLLMDNGTWYSFAHHPHAQTETIVGHTTLATGAYPSHHGIIANEWFDQVTGEEQYAIKDFRYQLVGINKCREVKVGVSPQAILSKTFADELIQSTGGKAKAFAVSAKDRGAVSMAGHSGKAFWFDSDSKTGGHFISSSYYYTEPPSPFPEQVTPPLFPEWVTRWNKQHYADRFENLPWSWSLLKPRSTYMFADYINEYEQGSPPEKDMKLLELCGFRRTFPHRFDNPKLRLMNFYYAVITMSPVVDQLTLDFAKELIAQEQLGTDDVPDYLAISFSATDIIAHHFGPSSLESEDNLLRLDRVLADLFSFVDQRVGLDNTLIVLAGDHGGPDFPEYLDKIGGNTGRLEIDVDALRELLEERFGQGSREFIRKDGFILPYFYLDRTLIKDRGLKQVDIERFLAEKLMKIPGVELAVPCSDLLMKGEEKTDTYVVEHIRRNPRRLMKPNKVYLVEEVIDQIRRNHHPGRSGDIYVVQQRNWQVKQKPSSGESLLGDFELLEHGSPWAYDTYVPIAFAGARIPAVLVSRKVYTVDVAATLSAYLKMKPPSGCVGTPLTEVLDSMVTTPRLRATPPRK